MGCGGDREEKKHYEHLEELDRESTLAGQKERADEASARSVEVVEEEIERSRQSGRSAE